MAGEQPADGLRDIADAGTDPVLYVIIAPVVRDVTPKVYGHFGSEVDARERARELGGGYLVAEFRFTAGPRRVRTALDALAAELDRRGRVREGTADNDDDPANWAPVGPGRSLVFGP